MTPEEKIELANNLLVYTKKFNIPLEFLFNILEDQKVTPMIRGKAMEYNAYIFLKAILPPLTWDVQKLNLNAQNGTNDEDVSITHRRTGIILKVESKSAVRGSFRSGVKCRNIRENHFAVKCHRSRSNIVLAGTSNDRYAVGCFDVLVTNTSNAILQKNTIGEDLELLHNENLIQLLNRHYQTNNNEDLLEACYSDWRFCIPSDIAVDGFIPRTPYVKLLNDENWNPISGIEPRLLELVDEKRRSNTRRR